MPLATVDALERQGDKAVASLMRLSPWLNKTQLADATDPPPPVQAMLAGAATRTSSRELQVDFAHHELLATIGTAMKEHGARALAWHRFHTIRSPLPSGPPMLPFDVQRAVIAGIAEHRASVLAEFANNDFESKLDDELKDSILKSPACSDAVQQLSKDRPSAFDLLASVFRYRPELVEIQRKVMVKVRTGDLDESQAYYQCFMQTVPDSTASFATCSRAPPPSRPSRRRRLTWLCWL